MHIYLFIYLQVYENAIDIIVLMLILITNRLQSAYVTILF